MREGNECARSELISLVYGELHRMAACYRRRERPHHTLQPTALMHEAYLQLSQKQEVAEVLQVSLKTVKRDWRRAKDWLQGQIRIDQK
jgi:hypothetical protein